MIKWVTIVEVIEDINRLQEGEFLITTGFGMLESQAKQEEFRRLLTLKKLSGVAIYTGFYIQEIPDSFIDAANESALPLIEIPTDINFSMITKAMLEQIVNNQMQLLEYSLNIHRELTKLVLDDRSLQEITRTLATLTSANTIIYNDFYQIIHQDIQDPTIHINGTELSLEQETLTLQLDVKLGEAEGKIQHTEIGLYKISICPIIAKKYCYGWITVIKPEAEWQELDDIAVEHAATVYAIEYLKQKAIEETQIRLQGDFLEEIIHRNYTNEAIAIEQGRKLGYDLSLQQTVFYFTFTDFTKANMQQWINRLYQIIDQLLKQKKKQFIIRTKMDSLMMLTDVVGNTPLAVQSYCYELVHEINKQWNYYFSKIPLRVGIGRHCNNIHLLSKCAQEAQQAEMLSPLLENAPAIVHYNDLGMYSLLMEMREAGIDLTNLYETNLDGLIYRSRQSADLIKTLEIYLKHNQSIQTTADELFIHRHTLKYRLKQIESKTNLNLKSADERMKLQLGILAYKLVSYLQSINKETLSSDKADRTKK